MAVLSSHLRNGFIKKTIKIPSLLMYMTDHGIHQLLVWLQGQFLTFTA